MRRSSDPGESENEDTAGSAGTWQGEVIPPSDSAVEYSSTAFAVSADSGEHWSSEGAWLVAPGLYRIPLPLPMDGLRAVNIYVIETDDGLTLIDGGWAISASRTVLTRSLKAIGYELRDIRRFLVTHMHRDHYTLAAVLGRELGASVALGVGERTRLDFVRDASTTGLDFEPSLAAAGASEIADSYRKEAGSGDVGLEVAGAEGWDPPGIWLVQDLTMQVGSRELRGIETPGHTPGHFVFADQSNGLLFSGDHILPTITPSIGLSLPKDPQALSSFLHSLAKIRMLPDLVVLPAQGPTGYSSHQRIDELLAFHSERLAHVEAAVRDGARTGFEVANQLPWTRQKLHLTKLGIEAKLMAVLETVAHLDLLVSTGTLQVSEDDKGVHRFVPNSTTT